MTLSKRWLLPPVLAVLPLLLQRLRLRLPSKPSPPLSPRLLQPSPPLQPLQPQPAALMKKWPCCVPTMRAGRLLRLRSLLLNRAALRRWPWRLHLRRLQCPRPLLLWLRRLHLPPRQRQHLPRLLAPSPEARSWFR